jgi:hypothetical protein
MSHWNQECKILSADQSEAHVPTVENPVLFVKNYKYDEGVDPCGYVGQI